MATHAPRGVSADAELIEHATRWLQGVLPPSWHLELQGQLRLLDDFEPDGVWSLVDGRGDRTQLLLEAKLRPTPQALADWLARLERRVPSNSPAPWVVVAPDLSTRSRQLLREADVGFVDLSGHASLRLPHLVVEVDDSPVSAGESALMPIQPDLVEWAWSTRPDQRYIKDVFSGVALRIVRRLLLEPEREWRVGDMAAASRASKGMVSRVFATLERDAFLTGEPRGRKRLSDPEGLLDAWASAPAPKEARGQLVTTLPLSAALERVSALVSGYGLTGEAAADLIAPYARVARIEFYVTQARDEDEWLNILDARPTTRGANIIIIRSSDAGVLDGAETISGPAGRLRNVSRPQLYVDLVRRGGQAAETAALLKSRGLIWPGSTLTH